MCRASAPEPSLPLIDANLEERARRLAGGAVELAVGDPHRVLVGRRELALDPVADAAVKRGEDHVAVGFDTTEDRLGDPLRADRVALEALQQPAEAGAVAGAAADVDRADERRVDRARADQADPHPPVAKVEAEHPR